jgi:DNA-binding MarR family transcriptional regulator
MNEKREVPLCLLQVFSLLVPDLTEAFRKTQLTPTDLFVLTNIKYLGKPYNGQQVFLGKQMRDMLRVLFHASPSQVTKRIGRLEERGFLTWLRLSSENKERLFGKRDGKKFALVLCEGGSKKIEEFDHEINALFADATSSLNSVSAIHFSLAFRTLTEEILQYLRARSR